MNGQARQCEAFQHTTKVAVRMVDCSPDLYVLAVCDLPADHKPRKHYDRAADWEWDWD